MGGSDLRNGWAARPLLGGLLLWLGLWTPISLLADAGGPPASQVSSIRVLTWNVLAPSLGERLRGLVAGRTPQERARALLAEAQAQGADFLALQEVGAPFMAALGADDTWAAYYRSTSDPGEPPGGLLVLSRYPLTKVAYRPLPSPSGRQVLFVTLDLGGHPLVVVNAHLESPLDANSTRRAQIDFITARLPHTAPWVWMGDFNCGAADPEAADLAPWTDAWARLSPAAPGYTYDLASNPLARANAFAGETSRRLDRILTFESLRPTAVGLLGQLTGVDLPASDHYGVWADLALWP